MKVRPDNLRGFILTAETDYEKVLLNFFKDKNFISTAGVGGDMIFRFIENKLVECLELS